jgi:hypothetical protein
MPALSTFELGWLVGILEGEGTFLMHNGSPRVAVEMCDKDTIDRLEIVLAKMLSYPIGRLEVQDKRPNTQLLYRVTVHGDRARMVMREVVKYMSNRRRGRIWQCLNGFKEGRAKVDTKAILPFIKCKVA